MNSNENLTINLDKWFSPARMSTYAHHPDPESLYLWNTRVTKAFLEDLQHVEVLLRNCVDAAVAPRYGPRWYTHPAIPFEKPAERAIKKAERRACTRREQAPPPGRVIAELSFDFWAYLFTKTYASTLWPLVRKDLVGTQAPATGGSKPDVLVPSRDEFRSEVGVVYNLRNRCAHHEPIIKKDLQDENDNLDRAQQAIEKLSTWIDPSAAEWIVANSRLPEVRDDRPSPKVWG